jgi:hypothetical protein
MLSPDDVIELFHALNLQISLLDALIILDIIAATHFVEAEPNGV